jgi:hypothetical protein
MVRRFIRWRAFMRSRQTNFPFNPSTLAKRAPQAADSLPRA